MYPGGILSLIRLVGIVVSPLAWGLAPFHASRIAHSAISVQGKFARGAVFPADHPQRIVAKA
jgi:hypothetical protein